jgi:hypothetical protein
MNPRLSIRHAGPRRLVAPSVFAGLLVILSLATSKLARAQSPDADGEEPASTSKSVDDERYAWLRGQLDAIERPTERWFRGWTFGFGWAAVGSASLAVVAPTPGQEELAVVTSVQTVLGLGATLIQPHTMGGAIEKLDRIDASSALGQYERRRRAEYILYAVASEENYWHSWVPHLLGAVAAGGGAAVLIAGFHETNFGLVSLAGGLAIAELQIWTRPTAAMRAWRYYESAYKEGKPAEVGPDAIDLFSVSLAVTPTGIAAVGTF